jgi:hypothetical protein
MKKTFASAVTAVILAIILASVAFAAPAAKNNGVPFKGTFQATETTVGFSFPTGYQDGIGSGNATHLGRYALHYTVAVNVINISGVEWAEFTAANGDKLSAVGTGQATTTADPDVDNIVEQYTFTGGTGRFAGATGSFTLNRVLILSTGVTWGTFDGTLVLAH